MTTNQIKNYIYRACQQKSLIH